MSGGRPALALLEECGGVNCMPWGDAGIDGLGLRWANERSRDFQFYEFRGILRGEPVFELVIVLQG